MNTDDKKDDGTKQIWLMLQEGFNNLMIVYVCAKIWMQFNLFLGVLSALGMFALDVIITVAFSGMKDLYMRSIEELQELCDKTINYVTIANLAICILVS